MSEQQAEAPVLDLITRMNADAIEASSLDAEKLMLVRIAALVVLLRRYRLRKPQAVDLAAAAAASTHTIPTRPTAQNQPELVQT